MTTTALTPIATVTCPDCWGDGSTPGEATDLCDGCMGQGTVDVVRCPDCEGEGTVTETRVVSVPEAGNRARDVDSRAPCMECNGRGVRVRPRGRIGLGRLSPEHVQELQTQGVLR